MLAPTNLQGQNALECDAFERLCEALSFRADTLVAMLEAYFDEAGTDASKPAVAVGCYIATVEQWRAFNSDWQWLKDAVGVKTYFRRTNQESFWLQDETKHWNRSRQICVYQAQHAFIQAYAIKGFAGAVLKADYDEAITGEHRASLGTPYEFCLRHCLAGIANWLTEYPDAEMAYFIESGAEGQGHLRQAFQIFLDDPEWKKIFRLTNAQSWSFIGKDKALPLQAADALAYEAAKEMENTHGAIKRLPRASFNDLFRRGIDDVRWWPRESLFRAVTSVDAEVRAILDDTNRK